MRIAANTNCLKHLTLTEALRTLRSIGYTKFEVTTDGGKHACGYIPDRSLPFLLDTEYICLSGGWADPARGDIVSLMKQVDFCKLNKIPLLRVFATNPICPSRRTNLKRATESLRRLAQYAGNVTIGIENHDDFLPHIEDMHMLIHNIGEDNVGMVFDPMSYIQDGKDPITEDSALKHVVHVHMKEPRHPIWEVVFDALDTEGYAGYYSVEESDPEEAWYWLEERM